MTRWKRISRIVQSFTYALEGIAYVISTQRNMKFHMLISLGVLCLAILLDIPKTEWLFVLFSIVFVMCMELVNTAIEKAVDLVTSDYHPLAKIAKDVAAGAVLLAAIFAFIIGIIVFLEPLLALASIPLSFPIEYTTLLLVLFLLGIWLGRGRG